MNDFPTVVTAAGAQPTPPADILAAIIAKVSASNPGYTANLPGILIEDISSTEVASIGQIDGAKVDAINSMTPLGANEFLLVQLGTIYGVPIGEDTNTSVLVQFHDSTPGFVIAQGFTVSDGTNQFTLPEGGIIGSDGFSGMLRAVATQPGAFDVPAGTVQEIITSVPSTVILAVNNPQAGLPAQAAQTPESYRADVLQAGLAASQGMSRYLKTLLRNVPGVQQRLVSVLQVVGKGWEIIVGGGDPYQVANAIFMALFDLSNLVGSTLSVTDITRAAHAQVTTSLNHGKVAGDPVEIFGVVGMTQINGVPTTVASVISEKSFTVDIDSSGFDEYVSGGEVTPNNRNVAVSINDYPDTYVITYVNPPRQDVDIALVWNTSSANIVSPPAMAQLGAPAIADYINSIPVGKPINLYELQTTFQNAVKSILPPNLLTRMQFTVTINGVATEPQPGTGIIEGDPESYFLTDVPSVSIAQG